MNNCLDCIHYDKCAKELSDHGCPLRLEDLQLFDCCLDFEEKDSNYE